MPNPRLYPKTSTYDLTRTQPGQAPFNYEVPSPLSQAVSRRFVEQEQADAKAKDMKLSPLDRAIAGLEAVGMAGTMAFESIQQLPQLMKGEDAYAQAIAKRMYTPRYLPEKSQEYVGNAMDVVDKLQTDYKLPPIMPELAGFGPLAEAAKLQASQGITRGALKAGTAVERALDKPVTDVMNRGGFGAQMLGSFNTQPARVVKEKGGNWLGGNIAGGVDKRLKSIRPYADQAPDIARTKEKIATMEKMGDLTERQQNLLNSHKENLADLQKYDAVNQWAERNIGNYIKKEMATPEDPVRLMLEKRSQEIEAQFQVDMNRAGRTRARAEAEEDPRRKANLTRQAGREEEQAKFDRDFANEHASHLAKEEYGPNEDALNDLKSKRKEAGFAPEGMAKSEPAQRWENLSDEAVDIQFAKNIQKQQELGVKAQQAEEAYRKIGTEIENKYAIEFKKLIDERGVTLTDNEFDRILNSTRMDDKATQLGMIDEWKKLQSEYLQGSRQYNAGLSEIGEENPFVSKLDPETKLYSSYLGDLGIDHVVDVIKQDVEAGRIRPEQLNKLTMDQAVKRTAEFNAEQATKMRETAIKNTEGMPVHKDYGDEGYKWVELKMPEAKLEEGHSIVQDKPSTSNWKVIPHPEGEGYALRADNGQMALDGRGIADRKWNSPEEAKSSIAEYAEIQEPDADAMFKVVDQSGNTVSIGATEAEALKLYKRQEREQQLADALKYEGDTMGHCVGGYCPDVVEGRSRIYSLRDKRGEPHVTIEVKPKKEPPHHSQIPEDISEQLRVEGERIGNQKADAAGYSQWGDDRAVEIRTAIDRLKSDWSYDNPIETQSIRQIKGKGNARPVEKYDPYTQDFVKSGNWTDVGDLQNTGLYSAKDVHDIMPQNFTMSKNARTLAIGRAKMTGDMPDYMTREEYENLLLKHAPEDIWAAEKKKNADEADELLRQLRPPEEPPEAGMKAGGKVSISDNPDTMMMEVEDQKLAGGGLIKRVLAIKNPAERAAQATELLARMAAKNAEYDVDTHRALLRAQSGARTFPEVIPRAKPKTKEDIRPYAQKTADQLNAIQEGKFLRDDPNGPSNNAAEKSKKLWKMEQGLTHNITPLGKPLDPIEVANIENQKNMLKLGISGDTSISDQVLHQAGPYKLLNPSTQEGGALFGLRQRQDPAAWASNVPVLENVQKDVNDFSRAYGDVPVIGQYNSMGRGGTNFAEHFAEANLNAIAGSNMTDAQKAAANDLFRAGNAKSGPHPDFPGIEDPAGADFYLQLYPELRKHINAIMLKPDITSKYGLPDGRILLHAITEPELRDMPLLTSGKAQYELIPGVDPKNLPLSEHATYSHNLPRKPNAPVTQTPFPIPAELEFSDATEYAKPRYDPSDMTRVLQTASPRQIVDQQHIDEMKMYEELMREYAPDSEKKKDGGLITVKRKLTLPAMAGGGLLKKVLQAAKPAVKGMQEVLPIAEREANLTKFLAPSAEKRKMYHGSKEPNIKEFKTRKEMTDESNMTGHYADERDAVFLSPDPDFTKNFSQMGYTDTHQAPTTYPVYTQVEKPFDYDNPEHRKQVKETYLDMYHNPDSEYYEHHISPSERSMNLHTFNKRVDSLPTDENNWSKIESQNFQDILKDLGFDSFYTRERGTKNLGIYEPNKIKSAIGNTGTYDINEPDINKRIGGSIHINRK
jgi:hypothetical protein